VKVILHSAVSLDGKNEKFEANIGLFYSLIGQWNEDATLVGSETFLNALEDIPPDSADIPDESNHESPLLIVPDSGGRIKNWKYFSRLQYWSKSVVLISDSTPKSYIEYITGYGVDHIVAGNDKVDFKIALGLLAEKYAIETIRVDSGGTLNSILIHEKLATQQSLLVHPRLVGGFDTKSFYKSGNGCENIRLKLSQFEVLENDYLWLLYDIIQ
jgi:2,5-diamino-6-(ribosylamino)-4(3H)-pyrimidinone 5'-phosphate reductase